MELGLTRHPFLATVNGKVVTVYDNCVVDDDQLTIFEEQPETRVRPGRLDLVPDYVVKTRRYDALRAARSRRESHGKDAVYGYRRAAASFFRMAARADG